MAQSPEYAALPALAPQGLRAALRVLVELVQLIEKPGLRVVNEQTRQIG